MKEKVGTAGARNSSAPTRLRGKNKVESFFTLQREQEQKPVFLNTMQ